jgi:hypothetical protein
MIAAAARARISRLLAGNRAHRLPPFTRRPRINIHGAIDLETGQTRIIEVAIVDALSTIKLLESIEALYSMLALIHVFLDNARYHHAKLVQEWLARPGCRIRLHYIPAYGPHLNPMRPSPDPAPAGSVGLPCGQDQ